MAAQADGCFRSNAATLLASATNLHASDGPDTDDDHYHHIDSGNKAHVAAREGGVDGVTSSASI